MRTICFSGMDGSGKTTQCGMLVNSLRDQGLKVETVHTLTAGETVSSRVQRKPFFRILHRKLKDLPRHGFLGGLKLAAGLVSFVADAWLTRIQHRIKYGRRIVVYDRFFYDHLIIFAASFPKTPWWAITTAKILPRCDVLIIMEVPPEVGHARKPEDSIEKLVTCLKFYRRLAEIFKVETIEGTKDIKQISESVLKKCEKLSEHRIKW